MANETLHFDEEAGGWRYDVIHRMTRRCFSWDYHGCGRYMVTLTLADRSQSYLGRLVIPPGWAAGAEVSLTPTSKLVGTTSASLVSTLAAVPSSLLDGSPELPTPCQTPTISLSPLGEILAHCWQTLGDFPGVEPGPFQVMPEHFHGIITITQRQKHALGQIIGSFKARSTAAARVWARGGEPAGVTPASKLVGTGGSSLTPASKLVGTGGSSLTPTSKLVGTTSASLVSTLAAVPSSLLDGHSSLWSNGFCDSILWNDERYGRAVRYVANNPLRLAVKETVPDFFRVSRALAIEGLGWFSAVGNHFLLEAPVFAQIQCSRSDFAYTRDKRGGLLKDQPPRVETAVFKEKWGLASKLASTGAVLVSPCVSEGEREIARRAVEAGAKVIVLQNKGFTKGFKPSGKAFDQCAEGRLLMLSPIAWPWVPGKKPMTRVDACIMNWLAQKIAKDGATEINYRGYEPAEVGRQALEACRPAGAIELARWFLSR